MIITVKDIPEQGLVLQYEICPDKIKGRDYWQLDKALSVRASVRKTISTVEISVNAESVKVISCARCLKEEKLPYEVSFKRGLRFKDLSDKINLDEIIFQEIELSIPIRELCSPDCSGLCPVCGVDKNSEQCNCEREEE